MHNSCQPIDVTTVATECSDRTADQTSTTVAPSPERRHVSAEQSWLIRATSWLGCAIVHGLAMHGMAMYPYFPDRAEQHDAHAKEAERLRATAPPPRENPWLPPLTAREDIDILAWLASAPSHTRRDRGHWFRLIAVWPKRRAAHSRGSSREQTHVAECRSVRDAGTRKHERSPIPRTFDAFR